jgi:hypothetical protein
MQVTIVIDEDMVQAAVTSAIQPVLARLDRLESKLDAFVSYEVEADFQEEVQMGIATDKIEQALDEAREQRTVLDSLTVWAQGQKDALQAVRDDLSTAIERGVTEADLASLDEVIASIDNNTAVASAVMENTPEGGGEPTPEPTDGGTGEPPVEPGTV